MKLYLVDDYKIYTYSLPRKIEDAFIINYIHFTGVEETITFVAKDNKWLIESTSEVLFKKDDSHVKTDYLENDSIYTIKFSDLKDEITLYCFDTHQPFYNYDVSSKSTITLGSSGFDISYKHPKINSPELSITKQNNYWVLSDNGSEQTKVYLNNKRIKKSILNFGDVIFTNGLKIIWLDSFIKINNPNSLLTTTLRQMGSINNVNEYSPVTDAERSIALFNDNQVFFHTPRIKEDIVDKTITIEKPPSTFEGEEMPIILSVGTTAVMGIASIFTGVVAVVKVNSGETTLFDASTEIVLCITMIIGAFILPILIDRYTKKRTKVKEDNRKKVYREYLQSIRDQIKNEIENEKRILTQSYFDGNQIKNIINKMSNKIWSREITDNDFLNIRLGIGNKNSAIKIDFSKLPYDLENDILNKEAEQLSEEKLILENVPITISLVDNTILPIVINNDYQYRNQFINNLLLQLITYYSGNDLKIVILTTKDNSSQWECLKYTPHCSSETRKFRFYAETEEEAKQVSNYIEKEYQKRFDRIYHVNNDSDSDEQENININDESQLYKIFESYYLIITDNYVTAKRYGIIQKILDHNANIGFSLLTIEPTMQNVPSKCNKIVEVNSNSAGIVNKSISDNQDQNAFEPDVFNESITPWANAISNIPLSTMSNTGKLPKNISFLEMYKVGKIEQLNILNRWAKNDPTISISAPIGVHEDGKIFEIDLHEKFHGPHGLIAGSTGSGKSEFIITFILSMAINYHPDEVQFVLIDYKGGGLAGAFENKETGIKLPHLAGTITNLDVSEMNRTLVSINSELKRRQKIFNEARDKLNESTIDIYKYQRYYREGKVSEPISHLFIISDEFAELKAQQPDFMESLVSTARIGRSLGVHLILATQKPSGVVDDQIWSNSRFKICLKVANTEDSRELLRRPEAAEIKETGRFYLQVGFNELFELGQSAWSGAKYNPTDHIVKNIDDSIDIIDNVGTTIKSINDIKVESQESHGEQLTNIVKTLYEIALREKVGFSTMWLPSLPAELYLANLVKKYNYKEEKYYIKPLIGEYDDPERQLQGPYSVDFTRNGNLLIYGLAGSGKENLLMTILYSICINHTSDEANIYIMDFGAELLKLFKDMPHVGDMALIDDKEKIKSLLVMLDREIIRRKEIFSDYGGSYTEYIKTSEQKLPLIITVLNGWEAFSETYGEYTDIVAHLLRESSKYGIVFITTTLTTNTMLTAIQQSYNNKIALQLSDDFDYHYLLGAPVGLIPKKEFSRGIGMFEESVYEFQGAYIYIKEQINDIIKTTSDTLCKKQSKASPIPIIPVKVTGDTLAPYIDDLTKVPLGINIHDASVYTFNFLENKITQIVGNYIVTEKGFLFELLKILNLLQNTKLKIIDLADCVDDPSEFEDYANGEFTNSIKKITINEKSEKKQMIYVIIGIGRIYDKVLDEGIEYLFKIFNNVEAYKKSSFIIIDNYSAFRKTLNENWYKNKVDSTKGIWIGADVENQTAINFPKMTKGDTNEDFNGIIYCSNKNNYSVLKGIGTIPEEE